MNVLICGRTRENDVYEIIHKCSLSGISELNLNPTQTCKNGIQFTKGPFILRKVRVYNLFWWNVLQVEMNYCKSTTTYTSMVIIKLVISSNTYHDYYGTPKFGLKFSFKYTSCLTKLYRTTRFWGQQVGLHSVKVLAKLHLRVFTIRWNIDFWGVGN